MTETKLPEYQQELFTEFSPETPGKRQERMPGLAKSQKPILMSLTIEQILLAGIGLILLCCAAFFMGVLRGKSLVPGPVMAVSASQPVVSRQPEPRVNIQPVGVAAVPAAPAARAPQSIAKASSAPVAQQKHVFIADLSKPYTIQLVTYKQKELAEKESAVFRSKGYYSTLIPNGDYFIVCVGQYANKEEARKDLKLFGAKYKDCFLRRR